MILGVKEQQPLLHEDRVVVKWPTCCVNPFLISRLVLHSPFDALWLHWHISAAQFKAADRHRSWYARLHASGAGGGSKLWWGSQQEPVSPIKRGRDDLVAHVCSGYRPRLLVCLKWFRPEPSAARTLLPVSVNRDIGELQRARGCDKGSGQSNCRNGNRKTTWRMEPSGQFSSLSSLCWAPSRSHMSRLGTTRMGRQDNVCLCVFTFHLERLLGRIHRQHKTIYPQRIAACLPVTIASKK